MKRTTRTFLTNTLLMLPMRPDHELLSGTYSRVFLIESLRCKALLLPPMRPELLMCVELVSLEAVPSEGHSQKKLFCAGVCGFLLQRRGISTGLASSARLFCAGVCGILLLRRGISAGTASSESRSRRATKAPTCTVHEEQPGGHHKTLRKHQH